MTPEQVLDKQMLLRSFWEQPPARNFADYMAEAILDRRRDNPVYDPLTHQHQLLGEAETFYVTKDMAIQIEAAAQQLPDGVICPLSLPLVPKGFMWLDHPLTMQDVNGIIVYVRAITWDSSVYVPKLKAPGEEPQRAIYFALYADADADEIDEQRLAIARKKNPDFDATQWYKHKAYLKRYDPTLFHLGFITPSPMPAWAIPQRFLISFWSLIRQPLVLTTRMKMPRAIARRAARGGLQFSDITVVELRQILTTPALRGERVAPEGPGFSWQFRYPVVGHWKRHYYPKLGPPRNADGSFNEDSHRWILIEPYEKGPENAPLYPKDRIYKVRR